MKPVFAQQVDDVVVELDTDVVEGLSGEAAAERLATHGPNTISNAVAQPWWRSFLRQFVDPVIYLLFAAIVVSLLAWLVEGAETFPIDVVVISLIVVLNAVIGFLQEGKAADAVDALRDLTQSEATVVRNGINERVFAAQLVPGDVLLLQDGDIVAADARLVEVAGLRIAEATLTGESEPVDKSMDAVSESSLLADRTCMVFSGTAVVAGRARAVVVGTGSDTEVGRIATLMESADDAMTPLQEEIELVGKVLGIAVIVIAAIVVATLIIVDGLRTSEELLDALLVGVSLAVAAVPEGLPAVLSIVLALGVQRMSKQNALIKRLVSVEALGSATIICSDKTGTLTRNEMVVRRLILPSGSLSLSGTGYGSEGTVIHDQEGSDRDIVEAEAQRALAAAQLASDASIVQHEDTIDVVGDPTEASLIVASAKVGVDQTALTSCERTAEIPFSSERKRMSTVVADHSDHGQLTLLVKGAPEEVLQRCAFEGRDGGVVPLTEARRDWWATSVDQLVGEALRTLAIAYRPLAAVGASAELDEQVEDELILLGVVGIIDPPRAEAKAAIAAAHSAGIRVAMITGDHPGTARQIALELGIAAADDPVVTGLDLELATDDELVDLVSTASVYARVAPEHKLRIVRALSAAGEVVGMTGDGVNDAPALRAANIGVAMGVTGTDVSKEAADMILADDNFSTIVEAVSEGRAIFHNVRSFLRYLLSSNVGEVLTVFLGVVFASFIGLDAAADGLTSPLLAVQILWVNLITDVGPALALGVDPPLAGLMSRPPRRLTDRIIDRRMQLGVAITGLTMAVATLVMFDILLPGGFVDGESDLETARTGAFTVLVLAQLFNTFAARSDTESLFGQSVNNRWLGWAVLLSLFLQFCVVYTPWLNRAFGTAPLSASEWVMATALASTVIWVTEGRKLLLRRRAGGRTGPGQT